MVTPELLAPAGTLRSIGPLIEAGADAVYVGLSGFSSRPASSDLTIDEIRTAVELCHDHHVRLHVAINGCVSSGVAAKLVDQILQLDSLGVDAMILADWGMIHHVSDRLQHAQLHASTLLGVYNASTVKLLRKMNVKRVVLSTNLYLNEIANIINEVPDLEYEIVADGGICFNDNRICELPHLNEGVGYQVYCRQPYQLSVNGTLQRANPIAAKQIVSHQILPLYLELGIDSFKVEGRTVEIEKILPRVRKLRRALDEAAGTRNGAESCTHYICTRNNEAVQRLRSQR